MVSKEHTFDGKPKSSVNRWGVSAGIMRRTLGNLYVMAGAGYLENVKVWTCMEGHSFEYEPGCYSGLTAEGGLMLKVKHVLLMPISCAPLIALSIIKIQLLRNYLAV